MERPLLPRWIGIFLLAVAAVFMLSWILRVPEILDAIPGGAMVFNTAVCCALAAGALIVDGAPIKWRTSLQTALGWALASLSAIVLSQYITGYDLGVDWPALHRWLFELNPHPGRMAVMSCIGFILVGGTLILKSRVTSSLGIWSLRSLILSIGLIGVVSIIAYAIDLRYLFNTYMFSQLPTAIALTMLSTGLWTASKFETGGKPYLFKNEFDRITFVSGEIMLLIVTVCGVASFSIMQHRAEQLLGSDLSHMLDQRVSTLIRIIAFHEVASNHAAALLKTSNASGVMLADQRERLQKTTNAALKSGFSAVVIDDINGKEIAAAGEHIKTPPIALQLSGLPYKTQLLWDGQFAMENQIPLVEHGRPLGTLRLRQPLPELFELLIDVPELAATGAIALCAADDATTVSCMPTRLQSTPRLHRPLVGIEGKPTPSSLALKGQNGFIKYIDSRGKEVVAAYGPVSGFGLVMTIKQDTTLLYAPIRKQFFYLLLLMAIVLAAGIMLLRSRVRPLTQQLAEREEQLRMAIEGSSLVLWDWDIPTGKVYLNEQWQLLLGGPSQRTMTTIEELSALAHPDDLKDLRKHLREVVVGRRNHYDMEHRVRTHSGEWKWIRSRGKVVAHLRNNRPARLIGTNADIDEQKKVGLRIAHQAKYDMLTGLANRASFYDRLTRTMARSKRYHRLMALLYLDIDKFKGINDTLGHVTGDALLKAFSQRLPDCVRQTDTVARLGGDEFVVILEELSDRADGRAIAEKIVAAIRPEFVVERHNLNITTSLGLAFFDGEPPLTEEELIKKADRALYEVKGAGRNHYREAT